MSTAAPLPKCRWCGSAPHDGACPRVSAMEYAGDGVTVRRVEFHPPGPPPCEHEWIVAGDAPPSSWQVPGRAVCRKCGLSPTHIEFKG